MDVSAITTLISNVGFPIVACGVIAYLLYREQEKNGELKDAINAMSTLLQRMLDKEEEKNG